MSESSVLIIGVGVSKHGDSSAGKWVVKRLLGKTAHRIKLMEQISVGTSLVETWRAFDTVILIAAVSSGAKPGTLFRLEAHKKPLPPVFFSKKSMTEGVFDAIEVARKEHLLPPRLIVYGIEGKRFKVGDKMVNDVKDATRNVAERILLDLRGMLQPVAQV